jgi:DNA helicase-2/ATP-dependent DNA helicase PcrA
VVVTGVESSLVPHKSAGTVAAKAEEGRLLYVAFTRATDRLFVTHAIRRGGYARTISPFIADLDLDEYGTAPPPSRIRALVDPLAGALQRWRDEAARHAGVLPSQLCSDRDLAAIARARPATIEQLSAAASFGMITAHRLAPAILEVVRSASAMKPDSTSRAALNR